MQPPPVIKINKLAADILLCAKHQNLMNDAFICITTTIVTVTNRKSFFLQYPQKCQNYAAFNHGK